MFSFNFFHNFDVKRLVCQPSHKKRKILPEEADSSPQAVGTTLMANMNNPIS